MDKEYFLITTADERSWRYQGHILCLGEWCKIYDRLPEWNKLNASVVTYHWDDRKKLYVDYQNLRIVYEKLLVELSSVLNDVHGTDYSLRYWRILIGPWLLYFTEILFDRWESIRFAIEKHTITNTVIIDFPEGTIIPKGMGDFRNMYVTDVWNHIIYARIIAGWTLIKHDHVMSDEKIIFSPVIQPNPIRLFLSKLKGFFTRGISSILGIVAKKTDAVLLATYLSSRTEFLLQLSLKQLPIFRSTEAIPDVEPDFKLRKNLPFVAANFEGFDNCVRTLIADYIPTIYLEGFKTLQAIAKSLNWPTNPKVIFTAGAYNSDDIFKAWAAQSVEKGSPLVIGQHGGNLGTALWTSSEDHEVAIADRYLSWGWTNGNSKHYPLGIIKHLQNGPSMWDPLGGILLVTAVMPRYGYVMGSFPVATAQTEISLQQQYDFVGKLKEDVFKELKVRLFSPDWNWVQVKRWESRFVDIQFDSGNKPIENSIVSSRLVIVVYNGTVFLETLCRNVPTIIFWDPNYNELRPSVQPYFNRLFEAGILYYKPIDAAAKVNEIWDDVSKWWFQEDVQDARYAFCSKFANLPEDPINKLKTALTSIQ